MLVFFSVLITFHWSDFAVEHRLLQSTAWKETLSLKRVLFLGTDVAASALYNDAMQGPSWLHCKGILSAADVTGDLGFLGMEMCRLHPLCCCSNSQALACRVHTEEFLGACCITIYIAGMSPSPCHSSILLPWNDAREGLSWLLRIYFPALLSQPSPFLLRGLFCSWWNDAIKSPQSSPYWPLGGSLNTAYSLAALATFN